MADTNKKDETKESGPTEFTATLLTSLTYSIGDLEFHRDVPKLVEMKYWDMLSSNGNFRCDKKKK